jgi:autotransporter-associated beta strand protein
LFEIGMWNAAPAPYYAFRMVGFPGLTLPPSSVNGWVAFTNMVDDIGSPIANIGIGNEGWLRYRVEFSETQATIQLDLNRDGNINGSAVVPYTSLFAGGFENLRIGSPSAVASAGGGVVFDNIELSLVDLPNPTVVQTRFNPATGHFYHLIRAEQAAEGVTWSQAEALANSLGGHLVTINDQVEQDWITNNFPGSGVNDFYVWTGLNDRNSEGNYVWSSGEPATYTNWYPGEPNGLLGENYVHMYNFANGNFGWNDYSDSATFTVGNSVYPMSAIAETDVLQITGSLDEGGVNSHDVLSLPPGTPYYAYIDNTTGLGSPDTMLQALDALGNEVAFDDDSSVFGNGLGAGFGSTVGADGTIRLNVTGYPDFDFVGDHDEIGDYTLSIRVGNGDPADSNVFPTDLFGELETHYLRDSSSFPATLFISVGNDGEGATSFSVVHLPDGELVDPQTAVNMAIGPGLKRRFFPVAELPTDLPSGRYTSTVEVRNELNNDDPSELLELAVEIYDPPVLTDNSGGTIQVGVNPNLAIANAPAGPHPGALRAGALVTDVTVSGRGFGVQGFGLGTFIAPGEQHAASATFDRFGQLSGLHTGTISVDFEMTSSPFDFLNGEEPVPSANWNVEYTLDTINSDSAIVDLFGTFDNRIGVNNENTAATLVDGAASATQTINMQFVASPGDGFSTIPQLATDVVDLQFSAPGDPHVLQFTYAEENIPTALNENDLRLIFFDGDDWRFAVNGNSDGGAGSSFFAGSYDDYLASINGGAPALSTFGLDTVANQLWAVLDHASPFAAGSIFPAPHEWITGDSGNWSAAASWNSGVIPDSARTRVLFGNTATAATTVTVNTNITLREIAFDNSQFSYTLAGDGLHNITLADNALINVLAGTHSISAPLVGSSSLLKSGPGTLVLSGNNTYTGTTFVTGGRLLINGSQGGGGAHVVSPGATLGGNGTIEGTVQVDGRLAPGNSPGILTIDGDYIQSSSGTLEIEVGGLVPGAGHDQVVVSGNASLAGQLDVPIFGNFVPLENQEITFLTANTIEGQFTSITSPNLASVNSNLAMKVSYNDPQSVRLQFVAASRDIQFVTQEAEASWTGFETWTNGQEPDTTNIVTVNNVSSGAQQVNVTHGTAMVHQLNVVGQTNPITLSIQNGSTFSATTGVTIENKAVVELVDQSSLVSTQVQVQPGGALSGNGTVVGNLVVGATAAPAEAQLSPGLPANPAGHLDVQGNYEQGAAGKLAIDVQGDAAGQFDTMAVSGEAKLGGTLVVDASGFELVTPGEPIPIIQADSLAENAIFQDVRTVGNNDIYFAPIYSTEAGGALGGDLASGSNVGNCPVGAACVAGFFKGDMNRNGMFDPGDVQKFALALTKPDDYFGEFGIFGNESGNIDNLGDGLDFDDIDDFARLPIPGASTAAIAAAIHAHIYSIPEPASVMLVLFGSCVMVARRVQRRPRY